MIIDSTGSFGNAVLSRYFTIIKQSVKEGVYERIRTIDRITAH